MSACSIGAGVMAKPDGVDSSSGLTTAWYSSGPAVR